MASHKGHTDIVTSLLGHAQIDFNKATDVGATPLFIASEIGHTDIVTILLGHAQIDINKANNRGCTPLFIASEIGHTDIVPILLGHAETDVNKPLPDGQTPLLVACVQGQVEVVRMLLQRADVDINAKTTKKILFRSLGIGKNSTILVEVGATAISVASEKEHTEILELLKAFAAREYFGLMPSH